MEASQLQQNLLQQIDFLHPLTYFRKTLFIPGYKKFEEESGSQVTVYIEFRFPMKRSLKKSILSKMMINRSKSYRVWDLIHLEISLSI